MIQKENHIRAIFFYKSFEFDKVFKYSGSLKTKNKYYRKKTTNLLKISFLFFIFTKEEQRNENEFDKNYK